MQPTTKQIREWFEKSFQAKGINKMDMPAAHVARLAYAAGADAELEACCGFIGCEHSVTWSDRLRAARRPKPPNLKQQALIVLDDISIRLDAAHENIIRRALESLPYPQD